MWRISEDWINDAENVALPQEYKIQDFFFFKHNKIEKYYTVLLYFFIK